MYFKSKSIAKGLFLDKEYKFSYNTPHDIKVTIKPYEDEHPSFGPNDSICAVNSNLEPNDKIKKIFKCLDNGKIPPESDPNYNWSENGININQKIPEKARIPLKPLPERFKSFIEQVKSEHQKYLNNTVKIIRWRCNQKGFHNPFHSSLYFGTSYSYDNINWKSFPNGVYADIKMHVPLKISDKLKEEIHNFVSNGFNEPIGHELFREAWEQRRSNPRSSLVVGIAAAEIGIKKTIIDLVPDSEWLITNIQSPSIERILREYIPYLKDKSVIKTDILPSDELIGKIKKGVTIRNRTSHIDPPLITYGSLEEILNAIKDLLWILDYYRGFEWALYYVKNKDHFNDC